MMRQSCTISLAGSRVGERRRQDTWHPRGAASRRRAHPGSVNVQKLAERCSTVPAAADARQPGATQEPASEGKFVWTRAWYPVTSPDYLAPDKPNAITILGYNLVVWKPHGPGATWCAFRDVCPHRAAPLSEGAISPSTGQLECAYHGWQFAGSGRCQAIPQSAPGAAAITAAASRRSCATAFPTALSHGLLWVWMEPAAGEGVQERAAAVPLPVASVPEVDGEGRAWFEVAPWYVRDMQVDYLALMENSADPSHVHWTHAGEAEAAHARPTRECSRLTCRLGGDLCPPLSAFARAAGFLGAPDCSGPVSVKVDEEGSAGGGALRLVCEDEKKATFRELALRPPCMLW
jgi:pheophorbide a oxygenase